MKDVLEVEGIQCDNKSCNYEDMSVKSKDYESYIDKPCPKCGSNLLTEADYKTFKVLDAIFNNFIFKAINHLFILLGFKKVEAEIEMNGTGKFEVKEVKHGDR